jgi:NAD+ kinase
MLNAPTEIKTVGLFSKPRSDRAATLVPELIEWFCRHGVDVRLDEESAAYAARHGADRRSGLPRESVAEGAQLAVVLGGDGTLLSTARATVGKEIPVLAVNLGGLGFLTAIKVDELFPRLERALQGDFRISRRRLLHAELWRGEKRLAEYEALNDVVLAKTEIARMIELEVHVDDHFVCVYRADGLIVSTPTGSTAYSLSAGGPIVYPTVASISITPICPHTLTNRPLIMPDDKVVQVAIPAETPQAYLTVDGQVGELVERGDRVICRRSDHFLNLIRPHDLLFFDVLREKLKWGGR